MSIFKAVLSCFARFGRIWGEKIYSVIPTVGDPFVFKMLNTGAFLTIVY